MTELIAVLTFGLVLGIRHATDPDHVIAVSTIVGRQSSLRGAALIGMTWGIGHTLTVLVVGGTLVVFGIVMPPRVGLALELAVAIMLIVLGILTLTGTLDRLNAAFAPLPLQAGGLRYQPAGMTHRHGLGLSAHMHSHAHSHVHAHGDYAHGHPHGHDAASHGHAEDATPQARLDKTFGDIKVYQLLRPLIVGVVHGLAGSAAIALVVLGAIRDAWSGVAYLLVFGLGTIIGMMLITALIGLPFTLTAARSPRLNNLLRVASGVMSLVFGLYLFYHIGFVEGLFQGSL